MRGAGRNRLLSNDTVIQWYNQYGLVRCANKIVEITPEETRGETELRSLKGRISYLVSSFKRIKGAEERKQTLAKEFVGKKWVVSGNCFHINVALSSKSSHVSITSLVFSIPAKGN